MITNETMTPAADAAGTRYQGIVDAFERIYNDALKALDFGSPASLGRIGYEAYEIAQRYLEIEQAHVDDACALIAREALSDASRDLGHAETPDLPEHASELLNATQGYLMREITIQIERDVAQLQQAVRQLALHTRIVAAAQGISQRTALIQHQLSSREGPAFYFRDRRNAKWPSRLFVRSVWRQALLSAFNEVTLCVLAEAGIATAQVRHAHGKAGVHDMLVALGSNSSLPAYGEIRNEIFHPNAEAVLCVPDLHRA